MSAFVVTDKTINQVLFHLKTRDYSWIVSDLERKIGMNLKCERDYAKLGQAMFDLNCEAVNQRYGENQAQEFRPLNYKYQLEIHTNQFQALARLKCWLYQCTEGTVPETPLYQAMEQVAYEWAMQIVQQLPQYDAAGWEAH